MKTEQINYTEKKSFNQLLIGQMIYAVISIFIYSLSFIRIISERDLTSNSPVLVISIIAVYSFLPIIGLYKKTSLYKILLTITTVLFLYFLIIKNIYLLIIKPDIFPYSSIAIFIILIHIIGLILNILGIKYKFH